MLYRYQRLEEAVTDFCFHLIPPDIIKRLGISIPENPTEEDIEEIKTSLFEVNSICGESSITIEISSKHRKIRGILIGTKGRNISAIRHLFQVIGRQERINAAQITVIQPAEDSI